MLIRPIFEELGTSTEGNTDGTLSDGATLENNGGSGASFEQLFLGFVLHRVVEAFLLGAISFQLFTIQRKNQRDSAEEW